MKRNKLFYGSSYDRGLEHLLLLWPEIKKAYPKATLDVCYGWKLFEQFYSTNPERMQWMKYMNEMMEADGITHHGRIGKKALAKVRSKCGIWAYPTHFDEINCITALDCQLSGAVPVVMNRAALKETVGSGVRIEGDIYMPETKEEFLKELLDLMGDNDRWQREKAYGGIFAQKYTWDKIAGEWPV